MRYVDPDGKSNNKYGITYISYRDDYIQEYKQTNYNPGYIVQKKHIEEKTTITYYGNDRKTLENFQKENIKNNRIVWDCDESILSEDVRKILKDAGSYVIIETEQKTTTSNYMGMSGTKKTQNSPERIIAIYFVNEKGEITRMIKNEDENK